MIKNIVLQHQAEKERLLTKDYLPREKMYLAEKFLDTDLIKVIVGPRRAGKSVFATLLLRSKNFAYLNFDDENLLKIKNYDELVQVIFEVYPKISHILFDEIQNLPSWELFVNKLQRRGYNLTITGSNAKLLSGELATSLTGRYIAIELLPFSFREFLQAKGIEDKQSKMYLPEVKGQILNLLDQYLRIGGFPEIVVKDLDPKTYLETLFDAIILKDVVKRYNLRFSQKIYDLAIYLCSNFASESSFSKLKNILAFRSTSTLQNYLAYLEEAYLVFSLNRFSFKAKEQIKTPKKIYLVDNGFISAKSFQTSQNLGKLMENLVFSEMIRRGYQPNMSLFSYKTRNGKEVDFVLRKGTQIDKLIQISFSTDEEKIKKRETRALLEAHQELSSGNLEIITWDKEEEEKIKNRKIRFIPLWQWILEQDTSL